MHGTLLPVNYCHCRSINDEFCQLNFPEFQ